MATLPNTNIERKTKKEMAEANEALAKIERTIETAKGKLRNLYKAYKEDGFNIVALKRARKAARDPANAQMDLEAELHYRELLEVPEAAEKQREAEEADEQAARQGATVAD